MKYSYEDIFEIINANFKEYKLLTTKEEFEKNNFKNVESAFLRFYCPFCKTEKTVKLKRILYWKKICGCKSPNTFLTYEKFLNKLKNTINFKSDKYNYSLLTKEWWQENYKHSQKTKIPIICEKHELFYQTVFDHLQGHCCPKCKESKGERLIEDWLKENNILFVKQKSIKINKKTLFFDFFLPKKNIAIEYDGLFHFKNNKFNKLKQTKRNDFLKNKYSFLHKITLIRIPYKIFFKNKNQFFNKNNYKKILNGLDLKYKIRS